MRSRYPAWEAGWLADTSLPDDPALAAMFKKTTANISHDSHCLPHEKQIEKWFNTGIQGTTIHRALVEQFGFIAGMLSSRSFSAVRPQLR